MKRLPEVLVALGLAAILLAAAILPIPSAAQATFTLDGSCDKDAGTCTVPIESLARLIAANQALYREGSEALAEVERLKSLLGPKAAPCQGERNT